MDVERADAIPVTKEELKPVAAETLRVLMQQTGCSRALVAVLGRFLPSERALVDLRRDDWGPAIREIFAEETHWANAWSDQRSHLPAAYRLTCVRFYSSLAALMVTCFGEEKIRRALEPNKGSLPQTATSYSKTALTLADYAVSVGFLKIPGDPQGQLQLVKELGPQIYHGWELK